MGAPSRRTRSVSALESASSALGPPANSSAIVRGPLVTSVAAGRAQSSATTASRSRSRSSTYEQNRIRPPSPHRRSACWLPNDSLNGTLASSATSIAAGELVAVDPTRRVAVGRTAVTVTRLGLGTAEIGGLYKPGSDDAAASLVRHAWDAGARYFDTAPPYGYGNAERRPGPGPRGRGADAFTVSP